MPITEIPPKDPAPSAPSTSRREGDLYDASRWESAYRETDVPALLIQLQDDLSRSRQREAFWISVVVHLALIILVVNSPKFEKYFPKRPVLLVSPNDWMRQKELTYLELPPDQQKPVKKPDSSIISDKDRNATSRSPQLDRKELQKILDSARPGTPGPSAPAAQPQPAAPPATAQNPPPQAAQPPPPRAPSNPNQIAQVQAPPNPKPSFRTPNISVGSEIEQAARAAMSTRGSYGGDNGDYGLSTGRKPTATVGPMDILSDTRGVDFGPYLARVLREVKNNWYNVIPESARAPLMKKGKVTIQFVIMKDGSVQGMTLMSSSGDTALDRGAWGGITGSNPFPPLPPEFSGQYLELRFRFFYNPDKSELE